MRDRLFRLLFPRQHEKMDGLGDAIDKHSKLVVLRVQGASDETLQGIIDRPFKPSPFNTNFDLEKWCASIVLACRKGLPQLPG